MDDNSSVTSSTSVTSTSAKVPLGGKGTAALHKNPVQVQRRNARERNRVRQVNQGFLTLRDTIPTAVKSKKLSKVDTLRSAAAYIQHLREILTTLPPDESESEGNSYNCRLPSFATDSMLVSHSGQFGLGHHHHHQPTFSHQPPTNDFMVDSFNYLNASQMDQSYYTSEPYVGEPQYFHDVKPPVAIFHPTTTSPNSSCLSDSSYDYDTNVTSTPFSYPERPDY